MMFILGATQGTLKEITEKLERQFASTALRETQRNRTKAAHILSLTRQGLLNKIARYNIKD